MERLLWIGPVTVAHHAEALVAPGLRGFVAPAGPWPISGPHVEPTPEAFRAAVGPVGAAV